MRYLLFNVVVGAALLYLFAGPDSLPGFNSNAQVQPNPQPDLEAVADRMVKQLDQRLEANLKQWQTHQQQNKTQATELKPVLRPEERQLATPTPLESGQALPVVSAHPVPKVAPPARQMAPKPSKVQPQSKPEVKQLPTSSPLPQVVDKGVIKRRAEVLAGTGVVIPPEMVVDIPPSPTNSKQVVKLAEGESLMTPHNRRRELRALANDMETLYIDMLTQ
ncbi:hypothetical protein [Magnetococcus sp. PR-3]|uniref:hypothetical protein n=1 Tax=Magnetococcus sp. PR-3 TaxID=3120355 RepID=UPI002FCE2B1F